MVEKNEVEPAEGDPGPTEGSRLPQEKTYVLSDLEQVRVLANPLRIRILQEFGFERTTKQVAERLGEKPTRLYHHVDALERVGLIRLTRTQPNRGTVEKYYQAVARSFRTDEGLFSAHSTEEDLQELAGIVSTMMSTTFQELEELIRSAGNKEDLEEEGLFTFVEVRGSRQQVLDIRAKFLELLEELAEDCDDEPEEDPRRFRLTLAYYPLDRDGTGPD